jgi:hypothetical protein
MMIVIRIEAQIKGDTLYLPQLNALIGKTVEIVVTELPVQLQRSRDDKWISPLSGTVVDYVEPFAPAVAPEEWEAAQ